MTTKELYSLRQKQKYLASIEGLEKTIIHPVLRIICPWERLHPGDFHTTSHNGYHQYCYKGVYPDTRTDLLLLTCREKNWSPKFWSNGEVSIRISSKRGRNIPFIHDLVGRGADSNIALLDVVFQATVSLVKELGIDPC